MRCLLLALMTAALVACSTAGGGQDAKRGTILGVYELELDGCVERAHEAHDLNVYWACADAVDSRFGVSRDGGTSDGGGKQ